MIAAPAYDNSVTSVTPVAGVVTMCDSCDRRHAAAEARKPDTGAYSHLVTVDRRWIVQWSYNDGREVGGAIIRIIGVLGIRTRNIYNRTSIFNIIYFGANKQTVDKYEDR